MIDPAATHTLTAARKAKGVALGTIQAALASGRLPATRDGYQRAITGADLLA
jgi:hypothetical protein